MIPCIMIGDSIAVGVGQARPECETIARVGISSSRYVSTLLPPGRTSAGTAVISLGVNDGETSATLDNLRTVRSRIDAGSVVWLLPGLKEEVRDMIRSVAAENGDRTLDTRPQVGRDHLHPTGRGYEAIASATIGTDRSESATEVAFAPDEAQAAAAPHRRLVRHARALHVRTARHGRGHGHAAVQVRTGQAKIGPARSRTHVGMQTVTPRAGGRGVAKVAKAGCVQHCRGTALRS